MSSHLCHANTNTPSPKTAWLALSDDERLALVKSRVTEKMPNTDTILAVTEAKQDGQIIARLLEPVSADKRGTLLLDFEAFLKNEVDPSLTVWLDALGDRNSLRNLRGIEVKA